MAFALRHLHAPTRQYRKAFGTPISRNVAVEKRSSDSAITFVEFDETSEGEHWTCGRIYSWLIAILFMFKAHPRRWSPAYKCFVLFCVIAIGWQANYAAAISSVTTESMSEQFGVGTEVAQLSTALFFVGVGNLLKSLSAYWHIRPLVCIWGNTSCAFIRSIWTTSW